MPENNITRYYDKEASVHLQQAAALANQADKTDDPEQRQKYWNVALDHFKKAGAALETAKIGGK